MDNNIQWGAAALTSSPSPGRPLSLALTEDFADFLGRSAKAAVLLNELADRLFGAEPALSASDDLGRPPAPQALTDAYHETARELRSNLGRIEHAVQRLMDGL